MATEVKWPKQCYNLQLVFASSVLGESMETNHYMDPSYSRGHAGVSLSGPLVIVKVIHGRSKTEEEEEEEEEVAKEKEKKTNTRKRSRKEDDEAEVIEKKEKKKWKQTNSEKTLDLIGVLKTCRESLLP